MDVFPIGERAHWSRDPLSGDIVDGCVFGRGSVDMKCGTTASIFAYLYLHAMRDRLPGRVTLTVVSDEETGGRWGTGYLLDHHPELLGDCVLNGEPSSKHTVRFAEKGIFWLRLRVRTPGAHGAYPHLSASATRIAARAVVALEKLEALPPEMPEAIVRTLARDDVRAAMERGLGKGAVETASRLTLNIGMLHGGVKVNMLPGECLIEADIRLPVGLTRARVMDEVRALLRDYPEVEIEEPPPTVDATASDPDHPMLRIIQDNAEAITGVRPTPTVSLGGSDCRFWRARGVPAYIYGCLPDRMGAPDERVPVEEFLDVVRVHTLSAHDWLVRR
ncbi:MAG: M20/M25/M40 family metallo-hydrolase [Alphaproteobacteria bacterium]|nr:M20/M25/M40 family metallo-hydrolase [Alphaproteobacteria bacterium]